MSGTKFLRQIADYYTATPERIKELHTCYFIFPNKRSALFLKRYIQHKMKDRTLLMPRFSAFSRLASQMVRIAEADHFEQLFMLYKAYRAVVSEKAPDMAVQPFDRFMFWGDMILSDFDEIDRALADPDKIYKNLNDIHELTADYLTDQQKEVIRRIWGDTPLTASVDSFWLPYGSKLSEKEMVRKFVSLWEILGELYHRFRADLHKSSLSTGGALIRIAAEMVAGNKPIFQANTKYIFVGLSDVSTAELSIMENLHKQGRAEFFWDIDLPLYGSPDFKDRLATGAADFISRLARLYPSPADFNYRTADVSDLTIDIIGIPSGIGQAKQGAQVVADMLRNGEITTENAIETAVVLPDQGLLMPFVLALPAELPGLNVTMGLPYSSTSFAALLRSIISMQLRSRRQHGGQRLYFYQDVMQVLMHPHIELIAPQKAESMRQYIIDSRTYTLRADALVKEFKGLEFVFRPIEDAENLDNTYIYLSELLRGLQQSLAANAGDKKLTTSFEGEFLRYFLEQVTRLRNLMERYGVGMRESTFLAIFEKILFGKQINVEGTPLEGLQVMGVLETRALDFENIIYLSMNERCFPRKDYVRTMIPNSLRRGYGLPPIEHSESFYAYYFYRSLTRARHATLIYDSRTPGKGTGEMSRYLIQLMYLRPDMKIRHKKVEMSGAEPQTRKISVSKTPLVMRQLEDFKKGGKRYLSASSLKTYILCPLRFYLEKINGMAEDDEPVEFLDAASQGTILHDTMEALYKPYENVLITPSILDHISDTAVIEPLLLANVAKQLNLKIEHPTRSDLTFEGNLIANSVLFQIQTMLAAERDLYTRGGSFTYIKGEMGVKNVWDITPDLSVNFKMFIDRIDRLDATTLRFIDYKTGTDEITTRGNLTNLFKSHSYSAIFQLLTYAEAYHDMVDSTVQIQPALHILRDIIKEGCIRPVMHGSKTVMPPYPAMSAEFRPMLNDLITRIFDDTTPFGQCEDTANCSFCPFAGLCGREIKDSPMIKTPTLV